MKRICLITCYMGPLPNYFGYFTASCKNNPDIDFIVINDHVPESFHDGNIEFIKMNLAELNQYTSAQLCTPVTLASAWKINELKPLFGRLFKEKLKAYDHWGWCDLDIIWGKLRHFLTEDVLREYDVITTREHWSTGHFTLFRNNELCNNLYQRHEGIVELLNDPTYYAFEECCHRWSGALFSFEVLREKNLPLSMYDIIRHAESNQELKPHFKHIIREYPQPINYTYKQGMLKDLDNQQEFMYYHLIVVKKIWRFYIPDYKKGCDSLRITAYGIRCENDNKLLWFIKRAYSCYKGIRKSVKTQPVGQLLGKFLRTKN